MEIKKRDNCCPHDEVRSGGSTGLKFRLECAIKTSADATQAKEVIGTLIEDSNSTIFTKGAPEGQGAKVVKWSVEGDRINLTIESGRHVRVHDALMRLKKPLAAKLGKDFRIGIRGTEVSLFTIEMPSEKPLTELKVPYVRSITYDAGNLLLDLDVDDAAMSNRVPDRILSLMEEKIEQQSYGGKAEHWHVLWQSGKKEHKF